MDGVNRESPVFLYPLLSFSSLLRNNRAQEMERFLKHLDLVFN